MLRFVGVSFILAAVTLFSGCGSDRREGPILGVINALTTSVENIKQISARVTEAQQLKKELDEAEEGKKKEAKTNLNAKIAEVETSIEELRKQAAKFLEEMRRAEKNPVATTEDEKKALAEKYRPRLTDALKELSDERLKLASVWKSSESIFDKETFTKLDQMFKQAEGDFENLARAK